MRQFNLASRAPDPEGGDPDTTIEGAEAQPPGGGGKGRRLLVIVGALAVVAGAGYVALTQFTQFLAPKAAPPARPVRPIAKIPTPPPAAPPAASPAPTKPAAAPTAQAPTGGTAPAGAPAKAAPPAGAPTKSAPPAQAAPAEPPMALAPPAGARPARAEPRAAPGSFSLQVGAMINESNAQMLKQRLEQLGYAAVVRKGKAHLRRHVVTTGDFTDRAGADATAKRLAAQGIAARAVGSGGRFSVEAGSFANEDDAIDLARQLQRLNHPPRIQDQAQNATVYQVRVGSFPSRAEAQAKGAELKGKGFPYLVVKD